MTDRLTDKPTDGLTDKETYKLSNMRQKHTNTNIISFKAFTLTQRSGGKLGTPTRLKTGCNSYFYLTFKDIIVMISHFRNLLVNVKLVSTA